MTKEEKDLLLKDLCARLPYLVICHIVDVQSEAEIDDILTTSTINNFDEWIVKPYLRPMSSMTEEEKKEFIDAVTWEANGKFYIDECEDITFYQEKYDWLNAHHFDYRGLIEKGLAIEVTDDNNPYKE